MIKIKKIHIIILFVFLTIIIFSYKYIDQPLCHMFQSGSFKEINKISLKITHLAEAQYYFILNIILLTLWGSEKLILKIKKEYLGKNYLKRWALYQLSWNFFLVLLTGGITVHILKFLFGRKRPYVTLEGGICNSTVFQPFNLDYQFHSFPSGHSQLIFTVASFLIFHISSFWIRSILIIMASLLALSRVGTSDHFLSDVFAGIATGIIVTVLITKNKKTTIN